jgi:hypothetical protein
MARTEVLCKPLLDRQTADRVLVVSSRIPLAEFLAIVAHCGGGTLHSHSIISQRPNSVFRRHSRASNRTDTVRRTAEMGRWIAIDPESSGRKNLLRVTSRKYHSLSGPCDFTVGRKLLYRRRSYGQCTLPKMF